MFVVRTLAILIVFAATIQIVVVDLSSTASARVASTALVVVRIPVLIVIPTTFC